MISFAKKWPKIGFGWSFASKKSWIRNCLAPHSRDLHRIENLSFKINLSFVISTFTLFQWNEHRVLKLDEVEFEFPNWVQAKVTSNCLVRGGRPSFPLFVDICKLVEEKSHLQSPCQKYLWQGNWRWPSPELSSGTQTLTRVYRIHRTSFNSFIFLGPKTVILKYQ